MTARTRRCTRPTGRTTTSTIRSSSTRCRWATTCAPRSSGRTRSRCSGSIGTVGGRVADFPEGTHRVVEVDGREVGVFNIGGRVYGVADRGAHQGGAGCAGGGGTGHLGGPVCAGRRVTGTLVADGEDGWRARWAFEGEVIACPWHGLEYHVPTGRCLAYPEIRIRRYDVAVRGDEVVVTPASSRRRPAASGP